ncbi:hypothetical protein ATER59S_01683 [Aquamicrobium terrae]
MKFLDDDTGEGQALRCPKCGWRDPNRDAWNYLHFKGVTVFAGDRTTALKLEQRVDTVPPPPNRFDDAVGIGFTCESCDSDLVLNFYHHEGVTFVVWRVDGKLVRFPNVEDVIRSA